MKNLIKMKGDASHRKFFRKKNNIKSSIIVYSKKEKFKNLLIYDAINQILNKNKILAPSLINEEYNKLKRQISLTKDKIFKIANSNPAHGDTTYVINRYKVFSL